MIVSFGKDQFCHQEAENNVPNRQFGTLFDNFWAKIGKIMVQNTRFGPLFASLLG